MIKKLFFIVLMVVMPRLVWAAMADYAPAFQIDMDAPMPSYDELYERFMKQESMYDTRYRSTFDFVDGIFDAQFYATVATYGIAEKRVKWSNEEEVLDMLNALPKEMYQYIGPMLHLLPNISDKVLNLPGIKETKNKFPTRIAPQLKDMEDLEFLSPFLYFVLMPEAWPSTTANLEFPQMIPGHPKVNYDAKFYAAIKKIVPPEQYMPNVEQKNLVSRSDLRTINISPDSLLTSADIKAFIGTMDKVQNWANQPENKLNLVRVTTMLNDYEENENLPNKLPVNGLRDIVNPCQRTVQKIRIMGKEYEFAMLVGDKGFTLNEWAYTCDKTMKAYRLSNISSMMVQAIRSYQNGNDNAEIDKMSPHGQAIRYATMQSILEMYKAPLSDVMEVRKNRPQLHQKLRESDFSFLGVPVSALD